MAGFYPRGRVSLVLAWCALVLTVAASVLLLGAVFGYRAGMIDLAMALGTLFRWGLYTALGAIGLVLVRFVTALFTRSAGGGVVTLVALIGAVGLIWLPLVQLRIGCALPLINTMCTSYPPIHDITTDTDDPPVFVDILPLRENALNPPEYAGVEFATQQRAAYPDLTPIRLVDDRDAAFARSLAVAESLGWEIVAAVPSEGRIEASVTTFWFRFVDDVVIRIRTDGEGSIVDVRSKSRVGRGDIGANAERIRAFRDKLLDL